VFDGDGKISTQGFRFFSITRLIFIQRLGFLQLQQTGEIDYVSPIPDMPILMKWSVNKCMCLVYKLGYRVSLLATFNPTHYNIVQTTQISNRMFNDYPET